MPGSVFISYRRSGDGHAAGRLHRELSELLGREHVFMDVDDIPMGVDFHEYLDGQVARCDVFLAIIGPGWVDAVPRLASPDDFVRIEVESALARQGIRIIPLLIDDAEMPANGDLPDSLHPLTRRNGGRLTHAGFTDTVRRLARQIQMPLPGAAPVSVPPTPVVTHAPEPDEHLVESTGEPPHSRDVRAEAKEVRNRSRLPWFLAAAVAAGIAAFAFLGPFGGEEAPEVVAEPDPPAEEPEVADVVPDEPPPDVTPLVANAEVVIDPYPDLSTFQDCAECPTMVVIPAGTFLMGSPSNEVGRQPTEGPQREVTVPKFAIAQTEVTYGEWLHCVTDGGCNSNQSPDGGDDWGREEWPVSSVTWHDAQEYILWINSKPVGEPRRLPSEEWEIVSGPYRLPTEAEWEYAARAGTLGRFSNDREVAELCAIAKFDRCTSGSPDEPLPVGTLQANGFGLYDMHGNVSEWVGDCRSTSYEGAPKDGTARVFGSNVSCAMRVIRGGSYNQPQSENRSAARGSFPPSKSSRTIGFRAVRVLR